MERLDAGLQRDVSRRASSSSSATRRLSRARLDPAQRCGTGAEREVPIARARRVEGGGAVELAVVAVGRGPVDHDLLALLDRLAADLGVAHGGAADGDERAVEAQQLFDRGGDEVGLGGGGARGSRARG